MHTQQTANIPPKSVGTHETTSKAPKVASLYRLQRQCLQCACPAAMTQPSAAVPGTCCCLGTADVHLTGVGLQGQHLTAARELVPAGKACPALHVVYLLQRLHLSSAGTLLTPADIPLGLMHTLGCATGAGLLHADSVESRLRHAQLCCAVPAMPCHSLFS